MHLEPDNKNHCLTTVSGCNPGPVAVLPTAHSSQSSYIQHSSGHSVRCALTDALAHVQHIL